MKRAGRTKPNNKRPSRVEREIASLEKINQMVARTESGGNSTSLDDVKLLYGLSALTPEASEYAFTHLPGVVTKLIELGLGHHLVASPESFDRLTMLLSSYVHGKIPFLWIARWPFIVACNRFPQSAEKHSEFYATAIYKLSDLGHVMTKIRIPQNYWAVDYALNKISSEHLSQPQVRAALAKLPKIESILEENLEHFKKIHGILSKLLV